MGWLKAVIDGFGDSFDIAGAPRARPVSHDSPFAGKSIAHYVLFGPAEQPATGVNLLLAQEYLLTFRPAFGFNPAEAAGASAITIIADEKSVCARIVADLIEAGATVERISGTAAEVAAALAERTLPEPMTRK
jgi:hypothetical protein